MAIEGLMILPFMVIGYMVSPPVSLQVNGLWLFLPYRHAQERYRSRCPFRNLVKW